MPVPQGFLEQEQVRCVNRFLAYPELLDWLDRLVREHGGFY